jgi:hypothetical protein
MDTDHGRRTTDADPPTVGRTDGGELPTETEPTEGRTGRPDRFWLLVIGLLVVTMPALVLVVAYAVLLATRSVLVGQISPVEAAELYVIEVVAFALFSYLLYRLTLYSIRRQGAAADADVDADADENAATGASAPGDGTERPEVE